MNNDDYKELWKDLLSDEEGFRNATLDQTLSRVRRRKRARRVGLVAAMLVLVTGVTVAVWRPQAPRLVTQLPRFEASSLRVVSSRPLNPGMVVASGLGQVEWVNSSAPSMVMVETSPINSRLQEVTDEQLLAFAKDKPAVLVRKGPHEAELLVVDAGAGIAYPAEEMAKRAVPQ